MNDLKTVTENLWRRGLALLILLVVLCLMCLIWLNDRASGEETDSRDQQSTPYASGELLITYATDPATSSADEKARQETDAKVRDEIDPLDAQLLTFPEVKEESSREEQREGLDRKKRTLEQDPRVESVDYNYKRKTLNVPNDPSFSRQWNLKKTHFPKAWDRATGKGVDIAILDSGSDAQHPDLKTKVRLQKDFVDDDGIAEDSFYGHGTHVAGIAAAVTNNKKGIAGGCPDCRLMLGKVLENGAGYDSEIAEGVVWATDGGAEIINLSLGAPVRSALLEEAINYAKSKNVVVVAAAGNFAQGGNPKIYPAAYPAALAVAATDRHDKRDSFSSYGSWLDVAASGVGIFSTLPGNNYGYDTGTSMAAPHVAALAGLLAGRGLNSSSIRKRIESSAVDLGKKGKDPYYGYGRIDALEAVGGTTASKPRRCTIKGTRGSDILRGTARPDIICGFGGSDIISGGGGNDTIYGDGGTDILNGNSGSDRLIGGAGNDIVKDSFGLDRLYGGGGRDVLNVRDGRGGDLVDGGAGRDVCSADFRDKVARCPS